MKCEDTNFPLCLHVMRFVKITHKGAGIFEGENRVFSPLNAELNPIRHLLALAGAHHFVHVSRLRVKPHTVGTWHTI